MSTNFFISTTGRLRSFFVCILLLLFIAAAYHIRVSTWKIQENKAGQPLMFTLESALLFRYTDLALNNAIPEKDMLVEYPEGVEPRHIFSIGGGVILSYIYKMFRTVFPDSIDFERFYRYAIPAYFVAIIIPVVFFIGLMVSGSYLMSLIMAFWYGIALPSVMRSTGQEFMRENFALPLIFAHCAFLIQGMKNGRWYSFLTSGILIGCAWCLWDMSHLYLYMLALFFLFADVRPSHLAHVTVPIMAVTVINPYLRFHHAYLSVPVLSMLCMCGVNLFFHKLATRLPMRIAMRILVFCAVFLCVLMSGYASDYGHFGELFIAKLKYLNTKPLDPSLLSFSVRVLWSPALHSSIFLDIMKNFGCLFIVFLVTVMYIIVKRWSLCVYEVYILWCFTAFVILYILFVRVHVYAVFFAILIPFIIKLHSVGTKFRTALIIFFVLCSAGEYSRTLSNRDVIGREIDYTELRSLTEWLKYNTHDTDAILASFNLAGPIVYYSNRPVILQPKFEKKRIRDKYQQFLSALFDKSEKAFYAFCQQHGAAYFIYEKGMTWNRSIYAPAYCMALSSESASKTLAARFERAQKTLNSFYPVYENKTYSIFKVVSSEEFKYAQSLCERAERLIVSEDYTSAEQLLRQALAIVPGCSSAHLKLGTALWKQGKFDEARREWAQGREIFSHQ